MKALLMSLILATVLLPQTQKSVEVEASVPLGTDSEELAKQRALRAARAKASRDAFGEEVSGESGVWNGRLVFDFIRSRLRGVVIKEDFTFKREIQDGEFYLGVKLRAQVASLTGRETTVPLPRVTLNKSRFKAGDRMVFTILLGADGYVHMFAVDEDDAVTTLLPVPGVRAGLLVKAGAAYRFPTLEQEKEKKYVEARLPAGKRQAAETVLLVVTRHNVELRDGIQPATSLHTKDTTALVTVLWERLFSTTGNDWNATIAPYETVRN